jgi:membrane fusion protein (multidrug efflux system)
VRAVLGNPDHKLLPGMYASVGVEVGAPVKYITLPQTAVSYNPYGATVFVVVPQSQLADKQAPAAGAKPPAQAAPAASAGAADLVAKQVFVTTGATRGDQVAILKGVSDGDEIVTSGQIKLKNGALVTIDNSVLPSNDSNPTPHEQ